LSRSGQMKVGRASHLRGTGLASIKTWPSRQGQNESSPVSRVRGTGLVSINIWPSRQRQGQNEDSPVRSAGLASKKTLPSRQGRTNRSVRGIQCEPGTSDDRSSLPDGLLLKQLPSTSYWATFILSLAGRTRPFRASPTLRTGHSHLSAHRNSRFGLLAQIKRLHRFDCCFQNF
jgi:hypothetical protein